MRLDDRAYEIAVEHSRTSSLVLALLERFRMLLRDAVSPPPHPPAVLRIAIATGVLTAIAVGGTLVVCTRHEQKPLDVPMLEVASFRRTPVVATRAEVAFARAELAAYAAEAYPAWLAGNPDRRCPERLLELNRHLPALHAVDPWGMPYQFLCGQQHEVQGLRIRSAGPDRMFDTTDDLASH